MKKFILLALVALMISAPTPMAVGQSPEGAVYEYAIVKWDGPDRLYYNLPDKFELVHLTRTGVTIPREAQPEEFCLTYAANKLAKENWSVVTLDSRRIVLRRLKK